MEINVYVTFLWRNTTYRNLLDSCKRKVDSFYHKKTSQYCEVFIDIIVYYYLALYFPVSMLTIITMSNVIQKNGVA